MKKRPKDIIRKNANELEHAYVKFPGKEMVEITLDGSNSSHKVTYDWEKMRSLWEQNGKQDYTTIHEHPRRPEEYDEGILLPSENDIFSFLMDDHEKMMVIAQKNSETGKVEGYLCLRKTKRTPKIGFSRVHFEKIQEDLDHYKEKARKIRQQIHKSIPQHGSYRLSEGLDKLAHAHHLKWNLVPAPGYRAFNIGEFQSRIEKDYHQGVISLENMLNEFKERGIEYLLLIFLIASLIPSAMYITGFSIFSSNTVNSSQVITLILFFLIFAVYFKIKVLSHH
ncbi:MAG: hypothetical protein AABX16_01365 [Nanoarchaeota archaeon]